MYASLDNKGVASCSRNQFPCWCVESAGTSRMKFYPLYDNVFYQIQVKYKYKRYVEEGILQKKQYLWLFKQTT